MARSTSAGSATYRTKVLNAPAEPSGNFPLCRATTPSTMHAPNNPMTFPMARRSVAAHRMELQRHGAKASGGHSVRERPPARQRRRYGAV
ncbi:hypothetical protein GCM10012319_64680 [Comamonas sp. KCTC 72670]|nr:hypothetical protein GCM10012319_64680 [Comamonas sp. KCTC 72670]